MKKFKRLVRYDLPLHFVLMLTNWLPDNLIFIRMRGVLARPFFKSCGRKLGIGRNVTFYNPSQIVIGNNVYIAFGAWLSGTFGIEINDEVLLGPYTVIATSDHTLQEGSYRFGVPKGDMIVIGKGSWLGAHSSILRGTKIGEGALVAANSVVTKDVPSHSIVGGVPARIIEARE